MTDPDAFDRLVRQWTPYAEAWARRQERRCPGEDWWSPAGRSLWKAAATYDPDRGEFQPWLRDNLRGEMVRELSRWRRRLARRRSVIESVAARRGDRQAADRRLDAVSAAMDRLSDWQSTAIRRHYLGGETFAAIALDRGVTLQAVHSAIARGLERLRRTLSP